MERKPQVPAASKYGVSPDFKNLKNANFVNRRFLDANQYAQKPPSKRDNSDPCSAQRRASESSKLALRIYLERQGRNEHINLKSQIGYDGKNIQ